MRLQIPHSNVRKSTLERASSILTSIIGALHFGLAGRSIANGMTRQALRPGRDASLE